VDSVSSRSLLTSKYLSTHPSLVVTAAPVIPRLDPKRRTGGIQRLYTDLPFLDTAVKPRYDKEGGGMTKREAV
jgi:hypothetical protein